MKFSRTDFEQQIMSCWGVVDDLKLLYENVLDRPTPLTDDEVANILLGMEHLYQLKFEKLFEMFEASHVPLHNLEMAEKIKLIQDILDKPGSDYHEASHS